MLRRVNQLGNYKNIELKIDFSYLESEFGLRKEFESLERFAGKLFIGTSVLGMFVLTVWELLVHANFIWFQIYQVDTFTNFVIYILFGVLAYGLYLLRDRDVFLDKLDQETLEDLEDDLARGVKIQSLDITKYFDHDLIYIMDEVLAQKDKNLLVELLKELILLPNVQNAVVRLGLADENISAIINGNTMTASNSKTASDVIVRKTQQGNVKNLNENDLTEVLKESFVVAYENHFTKIDETALFIVLCKTQIKDELLRFEVGENEVNALALWAANNQMKKKYLKLIRDRSVTKPTSTVNRAYTSVFSATLVKYSRDFTAEVIKGDFELSYAREQELQRLIEYVAAGETSATLVLGEPGVGKTTFIKNLGVKMVVEDVPDVLKDMRLVGFDFNRAFALAKSEQEFKASVEKVLDEVGKSRNIILVLDDLDELANVRRELSAEIINLINDAIDVYKIRLVATSTNEGYTRHIKPYKALDALFNKMNIEPPSDEVTMQIIFDIVPKLETENNVRISFEAVDKAVELSHKYGFERVLPDKAIDLIEEAISRAHNEGKMVIDEALLNSLVASKVGVGIGTISSKESDLLVKLEDKLHERIIGQDQAVDAVASALRRSRAGLANKNRPVASFLFFGPTGVGKTELAKTVAEVYYGNEDKMTRLDMSEYQEEQNLQRLIGSEQGEEFTGGYLTEAVRTNPYSLVLLDEIEKANSRVLDLFLQILDEGKITDGMGREVVFTNTIIIATSNVASKEIADLLTQGKNYEEVSNVIVPKLREFLRVEFLNRFDKLIMFKPLNKMEVIRIAGLMMDSEADRLREKGIKLIVADKVLEQLVEIGYSELYGARELRRAVTDQVQDLLANLIIEKQVASGNTLYLDSLDSLDSYRVE